MNIAEEIKRLDGSVPETALPLPAPLSEWALFLDVDGTLLDIAPSPDAVVTPPGLTELLIGLRDRLDGALALISGREINVIDRIFAPLQLPAAGIHGAELRLPDGSVRAMPISPAMPRIVAELEAFAADNEGLLLEKKSRAVALHYRQNPALGEDVETFVRDIVQSDGEGLEIQPGKMVVEVRPAKIDKGRAVRLFLEHEPYIGRMPLVMGDDWTDEPAFRTANARGGRSIRIGHDKRATEANEFLTDPAAVRQWLSLLVQS